MQPRQILPGSTYHVVVRCVRRMFLLRPDPPIKRLFDYLVAYTAQTHGVLVHDYGTMSNHYHLNVTDPLGNLPDFMHQLNTLLGRGINALRGTKGTVFERAYSAILVTDLETFRKLSVYALANPCASHLVERAAHWTGASSLALEIGKPVTIARPTEGLWAGSAARDGDRNGPAADADEQPAKLRRRRRKASKNPSTGRLAYLGKPSKLPEHVELVLARCLLDTEGTDTEARQLLRDRLAARELQLDAERKQQGKRVLGLKRVLDQNPLSCPDMEEALFGRRPLIAARTKWAKLEAQLRNLQFQTDYRARYRAWLAGDRDSPWPPGSYLIPRRHCLACGCEAGSPPA